MKILITGATGNLGRHILRDLEASHDILLTGSSSPDQATVFDSQAPGGRRLCPLVTDWPYLRADIRQTDEIADFARGVDAIVHLAASVSGNWSQIDQAMNANVLGTTSALEVARRTGAKRFINASSINAFGTFFFRVSNTFPVLRSLPLEEHETPVPEDPYSLTKLMSEELGKSYFRAFGMEVVNLRLAGVWSASRYGQMLESGLETTERFPADLGQWVHIDDVTAAFSLAVAAPAVSPDPITIGAEDTKLPEPTMDVIARHRPELVPYVSAPMPGRSAMLSIARARTRLGYSPRFRLDEAIRS